MKTTEHKIAVHAQGIVKSFGDGGSRLTVLKNVDFDARDGEIMMLVGPSGCGKTTLLSVLAGTLRSEEGSIEVFGERLDGMRAAKVTKFRALNIGFIFQSFNLIPTLNCAENVSVPLLIQGVKSRVAEDRARELLDRVGLGDRWKNRPTQLSGGQQQRVAIARALVHEPRLVICDEPTASLDAKNGELVMELFDKVARVPGRCVIIVTHDNRIFSFADRIAQMDDGRIVEVHDVENGSAPSFQHH
ncbi:ABC transporter ATP-binding protein [Phragmitibacter flavus]|uniref:ABC transporter ATP-binding protein n=1 Tax=Phragmitibacter flavus TaxID=2576071 RepID=A0A5R8KB96_9BACT|nr:ABC transporter ATP-binding protein [Phragmitibacter flavus]TLD69580.1 ABC transporter ATP-binding protein [Phragmitibacter flavus]